ncbi:hypothetical protein ACQPYK_00735 [Streptosporangium sp. CA-135522]|uniref:hypothetical protein n=1 Tax=Streptosporangium sp. CA-135522 TaxID=3240072 RepID=UPI003D930B27
MDRHPPQARELLAAVTYVGRLDRGRHLRGFFACPYFGGLRPAEALGLRKQDCHLPATGWGRLILAKSKPQTNKKWTDSGAAHDDRGLKHRAEGEGRPVPVPPELVAILREHIEEFGVHEDGRLCRGSRGGVISIGTYCEAWKAARTFALTPEQQISPLAARPYDLRHAARGSVPLAQRGCCRSRCGRAGRARSGRAAPGLCQVHRWRR